VTRWEKGFMPEAMVNYLVRLGWGYGDQEIFSMVRWRTSSPGAR